MFRTLIYLKPDTYSEPSQRFKIEFFAKIVKNYNFFSKAHHLRSLDQALNTSQYISILTLRCILYDTYSQPMSIFTNSNIFRLIHILFRHIQSYCGIFRNLSGPILESKGMRSIFQKKGKKGKIFENLGKNVQNLKVL